MPIKKVVKKSYQKNPLYFRRVWNDNPESMINIIFLIADIYPALAICCDKT